MRRIPAAAGSVVLLAALSTACSSGHAAPAETASPPTYNLPPRTARPDEKTLRRPAAKSGDMAFTVIGLTDRMNTLAGSHADVVPKGQFIRIRLVVENTGRITATFDTRKQLLLSSDGRVFRPDREAMLVKRQPTSIDVGAGVRIEMDLLYDVPRQVKESAVRVVGSPTMGAVADPPAADVRLG